MKIIYSPIILLIALSLKTLIIFGQNGYKFIEPNISISFDSSKFKIGTRYSNTFYETESYDFYSTTDTVNKTTITVSAKHPQENPLSTLEQEVILDKEIARLHKFSDDSISILEFDKKVRNIANFLCFGFIALDKSTNNTISSITCNHISNSDFTVIKLFSLNRQSLSEDYKHLDNFLNGFKSYTKENILKEDSLIKAKYTINVSPTTDTIENLNWRGNSYFATVNTYEPLQHIVKEVRLDIGDGQEIFLPNEKGVVYIACSDKLKGMVERKGEFVLLNSFGKNVKIPFTFKYHNK